MQMMARRSHQAPYKFCELGCSAIFQNSSKTCQPWLNTRLSESLMSSLRRRRGDLPWEVIERLEPPSSLWILRIRKPSERILPI